MTPKPRALSPTQSASHLLSICQLDMYREVLMCRRYSFSVQGDSLHTDKLAGCIGGTETTRNHIGMQYRCTTTSVRNYDQKSFSRSDSGAARNSLHPGRYLPAILQLMAQNGRFREHRPHWKSLFLIRFPRYRMSSYSNEELIDMLIVYGFADCNQHAAR
ncbi:hypothetical protein TNCV_4507361 [Trichonephila clavipes]|nr:hypothetical protein TNCV_4507361 [Trichonephila clavipes]